MSPEISTAFEKDEMEIKKWVSVSSNGNFISAIDEGLLYEIFLPTSEGKTSRVVQGAENGIYICMYA